MAGGTPGRGAYTSAVNSEGTLQSLTQSVGDNANENPDVATGGEGENGYNTNYDGKTGDNGNGDEFAVTIEIVQTGYEDKRDLPLQEQVNIIVGSIGQANMVKSTVMSMAGDAAELGSAVMKYSRVVKGIGIAGDVYGIANSGYNMIDDYSHGRPIDPWDAADFTMGAGGLAAAIFLSSNPIGWAITGAASIYFTARFVYEITHEPK